MCTGGMDQMVSKISRIICVDRVVVKGMFLAAICLCAVSVPKISAQSNATPAVISAGAGTAPANRQGRVPRREAAYYSLNWGVDSFSVKSVESGELIRFSYRIVDAEKAKPINDKKIDAYLIDPESNVKLIVPSLEKVGLLRQSSTPIAGSSYWMAFSNPGRPVKRGDRVNIEIGQFHLDGVVVQ